MDIRISQEICGYKIPSGETYFIPPNTLLYNFKLKGCHGTCIINNEKIYISGSDVHNVLNISIPIYAEIIEFTNINQISHRIQKWVYDPEIDVNIWDLGLIYDIQVQDRNIFINMTLTSPSCGMGPFIINDVQTASSFSNMHTSIELIFDPLWSMDRLSRKAKIILGIL